MIGDRFGRLVVIGQEMSAQHRRRWRCVCDCGNVIVTRTDSLTTGHAKSCGCLPRGKAGSGEEQRSEIRRWAEENEIPYTSAVRRWHAGKSLDGYRKRQRHAIEYQGETRTIAGWARLHGLAPKTLRRRLETGWPMERALSVPPSPRGRHVPIQQVKDLGRTFSVWTWAKMHGVPYHFARRFLRKHTPPEVLVLWTDRREKRENSAFSRGGSEKGEVRKSRQITYGGRTHTIAEWGRLRELKPRTICWRLAHNWPIGEALTVPPHERRRFWLEFPKKIDDAH